MLKMMLIVQIKKALSIYRNPSIHTYQSLYSNLSLSLSREILRFVFTWKIYVDVGQFKRM
jgi:hypothetical protein